MKDLKEFTVERLEKIAKTPEKYDHRYLDNQLTASEARLLAKIALAAKPAQIVAWEVKGILCHTKEEASIYVGDPEPLYDALSLNHAEQDGWIKCSDRMPEDEQEILVQTRSGSRYVSFFDEHTGLFFDMPGGNQINCIEHILVTHWKPVAAPKPEM